MIDSPPNFEMLNIGPVAMMKTIIAKKIFVLMSDKILMPLCKPVAEEMKKAVTITRAMPTNMNVEVGMLNSRVIPPEIDRIPVPKLAAKPNNRASKASASSKSDANLGIGRPVKTVSGDDNEKGFLRL